MITNNPNTAPDKRKHSHYFQDISHLDDLDIYRVCDLFIKNDPSGALAHAVKKILVAGGRGAKDIRKDLQEAIDTLQRKLQMLDEDAARDAPLPVFFGFDPASPDLADAMAHAFAAATTTGTGVVSTHWSPPPSGGLSLVSMLMDRGLWAQPVRGWCPPGRWLEVGDDLAGMPPALNGHELIHVLYRTEREKRIGTPTKRGPGVAHAFNWNFHPKSNARIVAYTIAEKADQ